MTYSTAEISRASAFMARLMPLLMAGESFETAGRKVLEKDKELAEIALSKTEVGEAIRKDMCSQVYNAVRIGK